MAKVKTITVNGKASEYDVTYTKAYVAKIISNQSDLYSEVSSGSLPYNAIKEIYIDGILEAELIGSKLYAVLPNKKPKYDHYIDRQEPVQEEFDESHALDEVLNDMIESMNEEELEEFYGEIQDMHIKDTPTKIYLQSVTAPPPYWVTDTTLGDVKINYSS